MTASSPNRVRAYGDHSPEKRCSSRLRNFTFLFNFGIQVVLEIALTSCEKSDITIYSYKLLYELQYTEYVVLLNEDLRWLHIFPNSMNDSVGMIGALQEWIGSKSDLVLARK